jgi:hypothetical protein
MCDLCGRPPVDPVRPYGESRAAECRACFAEHDRAAEAAECGGSPLLPEFELADEVRHVA